MGIQKILNAKKFIFRQFVANVADFRKNNSVYAKQNHSFKKCQPREKFIFRQLVANFANFRQINNIFMHTQEL